MAGLPMMQGLTRQQASLLWYIGDYASRSNGASPSYEEMKTHLKCSSKSNIFRLLEGLETRGYIRRTKHGTRSIVLKRVNLGHISTGDLIAELDRRSALPAYVDTHEAYNAQP